MGEDTGRLVYRFGLEGDPVMDISRSEEASCFVSDRALEGHFGLHIGCTGVLLYLL